MMLENKASIMIPRLYGHLGAGVEKKSIPIIEYLNYQKEYEGSHFFF